KRSTSRKGTSFSVTSSAHWRKKQSTASASPPERMEANKPALVFLCQRLPYPPIKGERIASYNLLRHLTRGYRVFVGTFIDDPADRPEIDKLRAMVEELHVDEIVKPWAYARAFPRWLLGEPISFALFRSRRLGRWLDGVAARREARAIVALSRNICSAEVSTSS